MGLDQYLTCKLRTYKPFKGEKGHPIRKIIEKNVKEYFKSGNIEYIEISFEAGYWRKANAIHKWFVDNIQGVDDCREYDVSRDELKKLKELCKEVLKNKSKAHELLPTCEGFFFGGTGYDEWYYSSLKNTIKIINKCLKMPKEWTFTYSSSW